DPGIVTQALIELAPADVDGHDPGRDPLKQAVGEASGRRPDVDGDPAGEVDGEVTEGGVQLLAAPADEPRTLPGDAQWLLRRDESRRLLGRRASHGDPPSGDVGSGPLPAGGEAPTDELNVEPPPQRGQAPAALELGLAFLAALLAVEVPLLSLRSRRARSSLVAIPRAEIWLCSSWRTSLRSSSAFL